MRANYLHKQCSKASAMFFSDYDLLPTEFKRMLQESDRVPTMEDLKAAWELNGEHWTVDKAKQNLNVFEEEIKEYNKIKNREERLRQKREKFENRRRARLDRAIGQQVYRDRVIDLDTKNGRLVAKVMSIQEAEKALATRKENKDLVAAGKIVVREFVGWQKKSPKPEKEVKYMENDIPQHICKQQHNS